jgi:uncharacterized membrane protein YphA (DoxX/SURF4 family)
VFLHVEYVTDREPSPDPVGFLLDALAQPATVPMLLAGFVVVGLLVLAWARWRPLEDARLRFVDRAETYREFIPWIIRLSAGLVLVGAGLSRMLFEPRIEAPSVAAFLLTAIGFLLLLGLAVRPVAMIGLAAYAVSLVFHPQLVMMLDVAGALAVAAVLGPGRPSVDDLLRAAFPRGPGSRAATKNLAAGRYDDVVPLLVRLGLGGAFAASGIVDKLVIYEQALDAVHKYGLTAVLPVSPEMWVVGASAAETAVGVAVLLGIMTRFSAIVAFAVLTLALFALPGDPVVAHVALFGLSSALVILGGGRWSADRAFLRPIGERLRRQTQ